MENARKYVLLSYAAFSALIAYVLFAIMQKAAIPLDLEARFRHTDMAIQGGTIAIGVLLFTYLIRHREANVFMDEVLAELGRVTWPTQKDTSKATIVVIVMVLISGVILGGLDTLWTWILKFVL